MYLVIFEDGSVKRYGVLSDEAIGNFVASSCQVLKVGRMFGSDTVHELGEDGSSVQEILEERDI